MVRQNKQCTCVLLPRGIYSLNQNCPSTKTKNPKMYTKYGEDKDKCIEVNSVRVHLLLPRGIYSLNQNCPSTKTIIETKKQNKTKFILKIWRKRDKHK